MSQTRPVGAMLYRAAKRGAADVVYAVAKWRDSTGRQNYRRVGRAWVEPDGAGGWRARRGRAPEGCVYRRAAQPAMDVLIEETERTLVEVQPHREATFADAVAEWREWAEHTKRLKPATLRRRLLLPANAWGFDVGVITSLSVRLLTGLARWHEAH